MQSVPGQKLGYVQQAQTGGSIGNRELLEGNPAACSGGIGGCCNLLGPYDTTLLSTAAKKHATSAAVQFWVNLILHIANLIFSVGAGAYTINHYINGKVDHDSDPTTDKVKYDTLIGQDVYSWSVVLLVFTLIGFLGTFFFQGFYKQALGYPIIAHINLACFMVAWACSIKISYWLSTKKDDIHHSVTLRDPDADYWIYFAPYLQAFVIAGMITTPICGNYMKATEL